MVAKCRCDGPRALRWVHDAFGDCITTHAAFASLAFGLVSLAFAFAAQAPQVVKNCRLNSAAALSPGLLLGWLLGDGCNLAGALLTGALPTQVASAGFLISMDVILGLQWLLLPCKCARWGCCCRRVAAATAVMQLAAAPLAAAAASSPPPPPLPRCGSQFKLPWRGPRAGVGFALGCVSAAAYITGISMQVAKTARRRSDVGLSRPTFALVCATNVAYALSLLLRLRDAADAAAAAPWLLGSAVPAALDATVLLQAHVYGRARRSAEAAMA